MKTNSLKIKIPLIITIVFFCVSIFLFLFFFKLTNDNYEESLLKESEWQRESSRRDELRTLDSSIKIIEAERAQLETHFAQSSDIVPFLNTMEDLASKVGAKAEIRSVDILKDHTGLLLGLNASGPFASLYKFLTLLENSPYQLEFISMNMQKGASSNGADGKSATASQWDVSFKIKLLSFIE